jgi:hypothetical protein
MKMKLLLILLMFAGMAEAQEFNLNWIDRDAATKAAAARSFVRQKSLLTTRIPSGMDIKFHRILLTLDPAVRYVTGSVSTYFVPRPETNGVIAFDLSDSLRINAIRYHGHLLTTYTRLHNKLIITLPDTSLVIPLDSIMVDYEGVPLEDGLGSFALSKHGPDSIPVLYTHSEPYGAMDWWPCSQDLDDKIDSVHLVITVPPQYRAAANGMLVGEQHCTDRSIYQWKHKHPIAAYLVGVAVTNYAWYSDYVLVPDGKPIEILNYVYPEDSATVRWQIVKIRKPFQIYNELFGLYPFADERYGHAQWNWGGGMEHQTMSFMGSFGYDLMAHELAHQWFGDYVTCGSWRDIWLNEGFATYLTGLCYERDQDGIYWEPFKRLSINRVIGKPDGSVYCYDTTDVDRVFDARLSYSKGAMVLHMLRWEMGDSSFFLALNHYLHDPLLANGYARTEDLMAHCEAAADTSFREFFDDWVYGQGYPTYQMTYRISNGHELEIQLDQQQSDPSVDFFEMDVPVRLFGTASSSAGASVIPAKSLPPRKRGAGTGFQLTGSEVSTTFVLHHTYSGQLFHLDPGFKIDSVQFDPDRWICTANPVVLGVNETPYKPDISIYPNPFRDEVVITLTQPADNLTIRIFNSSGALVRSQKIPAGTARVTIPTDDLPAGIYIVSAGEWARKKVIKAQGSRIR